MICQKHGGGGHGAPASLAPTALVVVQTFPLLTADFFARHLHIAETRMKEPLRYCKDL